MKRSPSLVSLGEVPKASALVASLSKELNVDKSVLSALDVSEAGDLSKVGESLGRVLKFLALWRGGSYWSDAAYSAPVNSSDLSRARHRSSSFKKLHDEVQAERRASAAARTEGTLEKLANGDWAADPKKLPPDTRAAMALLGAYDGAFKPGGSAQAQQVIINLGI